MNHRDWIKGMVLQLVGGGGGELALHACVSDYRVYIPFCLFYVKYVNQSLSLFFSLSLSPSLSSLFRTRNTRAHTHTPSARAALKYAGAKSQDSSAS